MSASAQSLAGRVFSLSGTGPSMAFWMNGCGFELQRAGIPAARFAGASGGAFTACALAAGMDLSWDGDFIQRLLHHTQRAMDKKATIREGLTATLEETLPEDVASKISGRVSIAMTPAPDTESFRKWTSNPPLLVDAFTDKPDVIAALTASSQFPMMIDPGKIKVEFRDELYVDGALAGWAFPPIEGAVNISCYPRAEECTQSVLAEQSFLARRVAPLMARQSNKDDRKVHVHPFLAPDFRLWFQDLAVRPIEAEQQKVRYELGRQAVQVWLDAGGGDAVG